MKFNLLFQSNLIIFICIILFQTVYNDPGTPWFIYRDAVFYIETRPSFTNIESGNQCRDKYLTAESYDYPGTPVPLVIKNIYGISTTLWYPPYIEDENTCYALSTEKGPFQAPNCTVLMGYICQRGYTGATAFYKNGTSSDIAKEKVEDVCNPHLNDYDETLKLCAIHFYSQPQS